MSIWHPKVIAATLGAGAGAAVGEFLSWLLGVTVFHASVAAGSAATAVAAVPAPVAGLLAVIVGAAGAALAGYRTSSPSAPDKISGADPVAMAPTLLQAAPTMTMGGGPATTGGGPIPPPAAGMPFTIPAELLQTNP